MPKDVRMGGAHDTEDSWEVLSRTSSNSSTDSRTPVALHFPAAPLERSASLQLEHDLGLPQTAAQSPPRRMSLDEKPLASRRRVIGRRFRRRPFAVAQGDPSEEDAAMGASGDSDGSSKSTPELQHPDTPPQPPQQFYGVLAGDSWYSVAGPTPTAAPPPLTIVFAGFSGSGKTSTCSSFSGVASEAAAAEEGTDSENTAIVVLEGRTVTIVDTPGLGQQGAQEAVLAALREQSLQGGNVALALTVSILMPFDDGQAAAVSALLAAAGPDAAAHTVLVFTHGDAADQDRAFLPNYLDEAPATLQEIARAVGGRSTVLANTAEGASGGVDDSRSVQVSRVLVLASDVAALGDSAPWVSHVHDDDSSSQPGVGSDVSRLRKAVVYSLAACGMMGLRVLTSGGSGFIKRRSGTSCNSSASGPQAGSAPQLCSPLVWHLGEDAVAADDYFSSDDAQRSDGEAFALIATGAL